PKKYRNFATLWNMTKHARGPYRRSQKSERLQGLIGSAFGRVLARFVTVTGFVTPVPRHAHFPSHNRFFREDCRECVGPGSILALLFCPTHGIERSTASGIVNDPKIFGSGHTALTAPDARYDIGNGFWRV
ncbi:hypothetical protein, partial [Tateyamaria pelophila]|uniref:hypothetical protein n=1 Tax=Tateyamaria pelophila TaxID=328415 RepID=UPI001CBBEA9D